MVVSVCLSRFGRFDLCLYVVGTDLEACVVVLRERGFDALFTLRWADGYGLDEGFVIFRHGQEMALSSLW